MTILYSLSKTSKLKHEESRLKCLTHHGLWNLLTLCHNLLQKVKVVEFRLAHFHVLFIFFFWGLLYFLSLLIFLLGLFTLFFIFYFLFFFYFYKIWENNLQKAKYVHIYKTIKVNSKFMNPIIIGL